MQLTLQRSMRVTAKSKRDWDGVTSCMRSTGYKSKIRMIHQRCNEFRIFLGNLLFDRKTVISELVLETSREYVVWILPQQRNRKQKNYICNNGIKTAKWTECEWANCIGWVIQQIDKIRIRTFSLLISLWCKTKLSNEVVNTEESELKHWHKKQHKINRIRASKRQWVNYSTNLKNKKKTITSKNISWNGIK